VIFGIVVFVRLIVVVGMAECRKSHCHQFDEEEDEDCHEGYAFYPVVGGDGAG